MAASPELLNRRFVLAARPAGRPTPDHFTIVQCERPSPAEGEFLVRTRLISVDPMIRILIDAHPLDGLVPPLPIGALIPGAAVGEVVESRHLDFAVGTLVEGRFGWQLFALSNGAGVQPVDPDLAPPETALGVLGLPGFSAYAGLEVAGPIAPGQTILVSGAAGAVGSVVGPLARARGARPVGIASGAPKRDYLLGLGYEAVIDRTADNWKQQLADALPKGADIYFDNVGGPLFGEVLGRMAKGGRIVICGLMAQYNGSDDAATEMSLSGALTAIMARGLTIKAFSNVQYGHLRESFVAEVGAMIRSGALPVSTVIVDGFNTIPATFAGLFDQGVAGKVAVRI